MPPLHEANWPSPVHAAWHAAIDENNLFAVSSHGGLTGAAAHWSPASQNMTRSGASRFLGWCRERQKLTHSTTIADLADPGLIGAYAASLVAHPRISAWLYLKQLSDFIRVTAPDVDRTRLQALVADSRRRIPRKEMWKADLPPRDDVIDAGLQLLSCNDPNSPQLDHALRARDGLMIALLAYAPKRLSDFVRLRIGLNVRLYRGKTCLALRARKTQAHRAIDIISLPASIHHAIYTYLATYYPVLSGGAALDLQRFDGTIPTRSDGAGAQAGWDAPLWLNRSGRGITPEHLRVRVMQTTQATLGHAITPQAFRHLLATDAGRFATPDYTVRQLGHHNRRTSDDVYRMPDRAFHLQTARLR